MPVGQLVEVRAAVLLLLQRRAGRRESQGLVRRRGLVQHTGRQSRLHRQRHRERTHHADGTINSIRRDYPSSV